MSDMKELENRIPESAPRKADLTSFLNRIIQAANDPEVQKDFQAWKEARKNRKKRPSKHTARHLYLEIDLEKGLGD